jgi:hypothetical protein
MPTIVKFIAGCADLDELAQTNLQASPNIEGQILGTKSNSGSYTSGAIKWVRGSPEGVYGSGGGAYGTFYLDASMDDETYGRDDGNLYPTHTKYPYYIVAYENVPVQFWMYDHSQLTLDSRALPGAHPASAITYASAAGQIVPLQDQIDSIVADIAAVATDLTTETGRATGAESALDSAKINKTAIPQGSVGSTSGKRVVLQSVVIETDAASSVTLGAFSVDVEGDGSGTLRVDVPVPIVDETHAGVMPAADHNQVATNTGDIATLKSTVSSQGSALSEAQGDISGLEDAVGALAPVAASGSYTDLSDKPAIPTQTSQLTNNSNYVSDAAYVHTDANYTTAEKSKLAGLATVATSGSYADLSDKPNIPADHMRGTYADISDVPLPNDASWDPLVANGDYVVIGSAGEAAVMWLADLTDNEWIEGGGTGAITAEVVKTLYESNADTNAYTDAEKSKLAGLSTVATSGSYTDLTGKPTIPTQTSQLTNNSNFVSDAAYVHTDANYTTNEKTKLSNIATGADVSVQSDWNVTDTGSKAFIKNKPVIPSGSAQATNTTLGVVKGSISAGQMFVETDGSMSMNGYDGIITDISNLSGTVDTKVDKVAGMGLSSNDYTSNEKTKLAGIAEGANKYVLPVASASVLGGVKQGTGVTIAGDGTISSKGGDGHAIGEIIICGNANPPAGALSLDGATTYNTADYPLLVAKNSPYLIVNGSTFKTNPAKRTMTTTPDNNNLQDIWTGTGTPPTWTATANGCLYFYGIDQSAYTITRLGGFAIGKFGGDGYSSGTVSVIVNPGDVISFEGTLTNTAGMIRFSPFLPRTDEYIISDKFRSDDTWTNIPVDLQAQLDRIGAYAVVNVENFTNYTDPWGNVCATYIRETRANGQTYVKAAGITGSNYYCFGYTIDWDKKINQKFYLDSPSNRVVTLPVPMADANYYVGSASGNLSDSGAVPNFGNRTATTVEFNIRNQNGNTYSPLGTVEVEGIAAPPPSINPGTNISFGG